MGVVVSMQADVDSIDGIRVSLSGLSREFGIARETVGRRLAAAGVQSDGKRATWPVYRLGAAARALVLAEMPALADGGNDPDRMSPTDRHAWFKSETSRLAVEQSQGLLVPAEEVRAEMAGIIKGTVQMLDTLPDILERDCSLGPVELGHVEKMIRQVRNEWAEKLSS